MRPDASELALLQLLLQKLSAAAAPVRFDIAETAEQQHAVFTQRFDTVVNRDWARANEFPDRIERDEYDARAIQVQGRLGTTLVASSRIVLPKPNCLLPIEASHGIHLEPFSEYVEIGRTVVMRGATFKHHRVFAGLMGRCLLEMLNEGFIRVAVGASRSMLRIYRRMGLITSLQGPPRYVWGENRYPVVVEVIPSARRMLEDFAAV